MKLVAIPALRSRISPRLDLAEHVLLAKIEKGSVCEREDVRLFQTSPFELIKMLKQLEVDVLICGGLTEVCMNKLNASEMDVIPWIKGELEEVLKDYLE